MRKVVIAEAQKSYVDELIPTEALKHLCLPRSFYGIAIYRNKNLWNKWLKVVDLLNLRDHFEKEDDPIWAVAIRMVRQTFPSEPFHEVLDDLAKNHNRPDIYKYARKFAASNMNEKELLKLADGALKVIDFKELKIIFYNIFVKILGNKEY